MIVKDRQDIEQVSQQDDSLTSPKAKAERLKRIRNLANLSREDFCSDGEVNLTTLISWEIGRFGGLSAKGAARAIARVAKEGVFCTSDWLLYEVGAGPEVKADFKKLQKQTEVFIGDVNLSAEKNNIIEELILFRSLNKNAIDFVIDDDSMMPHYNVGDYVAGTKRFGESIKSLISFDCIAQLDDGRLMMRNLQRGPTDNTFNLVSTNLRSSAKYAIVYDVKLVVAAPIIWHRKKEPFI